MPGSVAASTVDRIDYSNDVVAATPKGPLTSVIDKYTGTGNQNFAYMGSGEFPVFHQK